MPRMMLRAPEGVLLVGNTRTDMHKCSTDSLRFMTKTFLSFILNAKLN